MLKKNIQSHYTQNDKSPGSKNEIFDKIKKEILYKSMHATRLLISFAYFQYFPLIQISTKIKRRGLFTGKQPQKANAGRNTINFKLVAFYKT